MQDPVVSVSRLIAERQDWVVVECSTEKDVPAGMPSCESEGYRRFFTEGHIPGARYADIGIDFSDPAGQFPFTRPTARQFEQAARRIGLSNTNRIAVYDRSNGIWAARLWWLLRAFGHEQVSVVDGGLQQWRLAGLPLAFEEPASGAGTFLAHEQPGYFVDKDFVVDVVESRRSAHLVNVLRPPVFSGEEQNYARRGHIPTSINIPYKHLIDPDSNRLVGPGELAAQHDDLGADGRLVVTYCGGGITAAGGALALAVLGLTNVAIYDGSLNEWSADDQLPLVVTEARTGIS